MIDTREDAANFMTIYKAQGNVLTYSCQKVSNYYMIDDEFAAI